MIALSNTQYISKVIEIFDLLIGAKSVVIEARRWINDDQPAISPDTSNVASSQTGRDAESLWNSLLSWVDTYVPTPVGQEMGALAEVAGNAGAQAVFPDAIGGA